MKTTELENYLKWQQISTAAIGRKFGEIFIKIMDFEICEQNSEIRALKLEVF
jgi:dimeric dUTPase (all-alpha-NTP-PPase superfamily)